MTFLRQKPRDPLWKQWDYLAQRKGMRHSVYSVKGDVYHGGWLDNKKHGKGVYTWKETQDVYAGDWKKDKRSGLGTLSRSDGKGSHKKAYSGGWKSDRRHGFGTQFFSDTEFYEGEWEAGQRSGWGRMFYGDGTLYEGEWSADMRDGHGMLRLNNENRYEGTWQKDRKNGVGKYYFLDSGQVLEGVWMDDQPKCGTIRDFGRDSAPGPTPFPIPEIGLADPDSILEHAGDWFTQEQEIHNQANANE